MTVHEVCHAQSARNHSALRAVLGTPLWLESKLHSYGASSVVSDFRKCVVSKGVHLSYILPVLPILTYITYITYIFYLIFSLYFPCITSIL